MHIIGPPFIRSIGSVKAVAGSDVTLYCPYSGYPISTVRWERRGQELPGDLRHRVEDSQAGGSLTISRVDSVTDSGTGAMHLFIREETKVSIYTCACM